MERPWPFLGLATPCRCGQAPSMTARRGPQLVWAGSRPPARARARDLDGHDGLYSPRSQVTSCGPGPRVLLHRRGVSTSAPLPGGATWGRRERRQEGSARVGRERFCAAEPRGNGSGHAWAKSFRVPLRSRVPVLDSCPFARLPGPLLKGHEGIGENSASTLGQRLRSHGR